MGTPLKISKRQFVIFACLLLLALLCANMNGACGFQTTDWGNVTTRAAAAAAVEYIADDQEFLMESDVNRRILAANTGKRLSYEVNRNAGQTTCKNKDRYGNCPPLQIYAENKRKCDIENKCKHTVQ